jgi:hypothetical protein
MEQAEQSPSGCDGRETGLEEKVLLCNRKKENKPLEYT